MASGGRTDIYRISSAGGGTPQRLTNGPGINIGGSYSPDGSQIVFESDRSGSQQIYVMNADGSNQRRISFFGGRAATPEWSPRGRSEEHTSELQSLMRISYAVFCLKKKKIYTEQ